MKITLCGGPLDGRTTQVDGDEADPPVFLELEGAVYVLGSNESRFRGDTMFYRATGTNSRVTGVDPR